jgi:hypothetical protein
MILIFLGINFSYLSVIDWLIIFFPTKSYDIYLSFPTKSYVIDLIFPPKSDVNCFFLTIKFSMCLFYHLDILFTFCYLLLLITMSMIFPIRSFYLVKIFTLKYLDSMIFQSPILFLL